MDPLSSLREQKQVEPPQQLSPTSNVTATASGGGSGVAGFFDIGSVLGKSGRGDEAADTVGERINKALAAGSNVDFPMITDISERLAKEPREAAEAVRLLHGAFAETNGPPRRKLKALTILNELKYDVRVAAELREVHGVRETLRALQLTTSSGLGESADEQIRMFATEVEKNCLDSSINAAAGNATAAPKVARASSSGLGEAADPFAPTFALADDPFAPTFTVGSNGAAGGAPAREQQQPQQQQLSRKRDQAMGALGWLGNVVGSSVAAAGAAIADAKGQVVANHGEGSSSRRRPEGIPQLPVDPKAIRPVLDIKFDGILAGEKVHYVIQKAYFLTNNPFCETAGRLVATNYRLKFQVPKGSLREELAWISERQMLDVALGAVEDVKLESSQSEAGAQELKLVIVTKDFRAINIMVSDPREMSAIEEHVAALSQPGHHHTAALFAFQHAEAQGASQEGWDLYDPVLEFGRMGVDTPAAAVPACPWTLTSFNQGYGLCDTYPASLVQPKDVPEQELRAVAAFRKRGRLPTLSWCGGRDMGYASLWRSSQPMEGILGNACVTDEKLVNSIRCGRERDLLVVDLRPWKAAYANKVGGGGFEAYSGCRLVFGDIDNVHGVRDGWRKMGQAVSSVGSTEVGSWFKDVATSGWYDIISNVLYCTRQVVQELTVHRSNTLIHCSDGWDRTAQVSSLVMLCMDPHYRTLRGFAILIQKEFCSFGHRFRTRLGNGEKPTSEYSPIFFQWLECVYQLSVQFPAAFEFSEELLLHLCKEVVSNRYGTFLGDNEKERLEKVMPKTLSFWPTMLAPNGSAAKPEFVNASYVPGVEVLTPSPTQVNFVVWQRYWFRYQIHPSPC